MNRALDETPTHHGARPLRLLVLGGTAFIGIHMTRLALERGHVVTLFNRGRARPDLFPDVEKLVGDRAGSLKALEGREWDAVIDNSGYVPRHVRNSVQMLAPHIGQYLFISSVSVYADFIKPNNESSAVAKTDAEEREDWQNAYGALKALCEAAVQAAMPGRATIIRPGLIVGPEDPTDRFTYWPARAAQGGEFLAPGNAQASYQLIDARDLARFCLDALERAITGVFNLTSPAGLFTMADIVRAAVAAARELAPSDSPSHPVWVSEEFLLQNQVAPFVELPGWLPAEGALASLHHTQVTRAIEAGLQITPLQRTTNDTLSWYLNHRHSGSRPLRAGIQPAREAALLAAWHSRKV